MGGVDLKLVGTALPARLGSYTFQRNNCTLSAREINNRTTKENFWRRNTDNWA